MDSPPRLCVAVEINPRLFTTTLVMSRSPTPGASRCYFDNLGLLSPGEQVVEVPALGPLAMWIRSPLLRHPTLLLRRPTFLLRSAVPCHGSVHVW